MNYLLVIFAVVFTAACSAGDNDATINGRVVSIADGDTISVLVGREQFKVRLAGIDCPEKGQDWGTKARQVISDYIFGKDVSVRIKSRDRYGRYIGVVYLETANINRAMVLTGSCHVYARYAKDPELFRLQEIAKRERAGLWSMPEDKIIAPWDFRRN